MTLTGVAPRRAPPFAPVTDGQVAAILFADVVGFSKLTSDTDVFRFFREFLSEVAVLLGETVYTPLVRNTWGDGLYLVFAGVREAGLFALALCRMVGDVAWQERGLPADLNVRVALHAGPLFSFIDPVTSQPTLSGKHVTRAARMEPVTPPGLVYASREFAAVAAAHGVSDFRCEPVGRVRLDKSAGVASLFVVRPVTAGVQQTACPPMPVTRAKR
jgi:class 3 adenylate cyclase